MEYCGNYQRFSSDFTYREDPCVDHPQNQCQTICVANHTCKRKFCQVCQLEHQVEPNQMIPYNMFTQKLFNKVSGLNLEDNKLLDDSKLQLKNVISKMEKQFQLILEDFKNTFKNVFELIEQTNEKYLDLVCKIFDPRACSNNDLDKLIQIFSGNILDDWIKQLLVKLNQKIDEQMKVACKIILNIEKSLGISEQNMNPQPLLLSTVSIEVEFTKQNELNYMKDGVILRIEKIQDLQKTPQIMKNIEQIKNLKWEGQYDKNKIGKWKATWNGKELDIGGNYNQMGQKEGVWKELFENYWEYSKVIYIGEYKEGIKQGNWDIIKQVGDKYEKIGGGLYDQNGKKNGNWKDLYKFYYKFCQIYFVGKYDQGIPIEKWDIIQKDKIIGGGEYDKEGNKIGKWKQLEKNFWEYFIIIQISHCQVMKEGSYQNKKKRLGRWDTIYKGKIIGGGSYDENSMKDGEWTELYEQFLDNCQVTYVGQYKNGTKKGKWNTLFENKIVAGGNYNDYGMKYGQWSVIHKAFKNKYNIIQNGKYLNGKKTGKWNFNYQIKSIGGGNYDENGKKIGIWTELNENYGENCLVIYIGEYKAGIKQGNWQTLYKNNQIGGGLYNENGMKDGKWIELSDSFDDNTQAKRKVYHQEYQNGVKIGFSVDHPLEQ
ncbi:unnamed protein product [Paramecium sonneborni]|uniref:Uncharacterized protein n=1 Tax=Paramecium sonneborni TaxID=65129 RepID=A0A8S1RLS3_9CILI|nr:unnamed protein product [Paramecium sonneborni]